MLPPFDFHFSFGFYPHQTIQQQKSSQKSPCYQIFKYLLTADPFFDTSTA